MTDQAGSVLVCTGGDKMYLEPCSRQTNFFHLTQIDAKTHMWLFCQY